MSKKGCPKKTRKREEKESGSASHYFALEAFTREKVAANGERSNRPYPGEISGLQPTEGEGGEGPKRKGRERVASGQIKEGEISSSGMLRHQKTESMKTAHQSEDERCRKGGSDGLRSLTRSGKKGGRQEEGRNN